MDVDLDMSALDSFAAEFDGFDFMEEVNQAAAKIQGTLRGRAKRKDGMMTMRNFLHQDLDESLALGGNHHFDPETLLETERLFQDGEQVYAMFEEDGLYYEATVVKLVENSSYLVVFDGYNNEQVTSSENIRSLADVEKEQAAALEESKTQEESSSGAGGAEPKNLTVSIEEIEENARNELNALIQESEELIVVQAHEEATKKQKEEEEERARLELNALLEEEKKRVEADDKAQIEQERKALEAKVQQQEREKAERLEKERQEAEKKRQEEEKIKEMNQRVKGCGPDARATLRTRQMERRKQKQLEIEQELERVALVEKKAQELAAAREKAFLEMDSMFEDTARDNAIEAAKEREAEKLRKKQEHEERVKRQVELDKQMQQQQKAALAVPQKKVQSIVSPISSPSGSPRAAASDEPAALTKLKSEKMRVETMLKSMETELKELSAKKLLRQQYRMEAMEESLNALTQQRQAIRLEARQVTILAKKTVRSAGRLHSFFVENIKDLTSNAKTFLTMVAILVNQTQFKSLGSKLHVFASNFQRELAKVIQELKREHVRITKEKGMNGGDLTMLKNFASIIGSILAVTNEIISTHEHSSAVLQSQADPMDAVDAQKSSEIMTKVTKAKRAIELLTDRIVATENQVISKPKANRRMSSNPSRRN